ncbi:MULTISPECIES: hypothetical protein [Nocardia]|uniref:hypothetical protein n=1 Tax=Nocardia TaxID=1817 RepID=UPI0002EB9063|nr:MULTISPECIES: hypothetical protein [Nocardia]
MDDWPDWIQALPQIATGASGGRGYLIAGPHGQVVLWSFPVEARVPTHAHGPQIGVVLTGQVDLTTDTTTRTFTAGQHFGLDDQIPHSAVVAAGTRVIEVFADPDRHTPTDPPR